MVDILDTAIYDKDLNNLIEVILSDYSFELKRNLLISASDANVLVNAKVNKEFGIILRSFYLNIPDGMPSVIIGRFKGAKGMERCYGPDLFKELITASKGKKIKHFLCGGNIGVADKLKIFCEKQCGNKNICGTFTPPFKELSENEIKNIADIINKAKTDILWIGLTSPKQHYFAKRLSKYTNVKYIFTIGAAFDFHTGRVIQAPLWIQKMSLEWLFRLIKEPKRLWSRYLKVVPLFIYFNILELLEGRFLLDKK